MSKNLSFNEVKAEHFDTLKMYVPIVARVHGNAHPEFLEVKEYFDIINEKIVTADVEKPDLTKEFSKLREITNNFEVPNDVCESYEAVYTMLSKLDKAYQS